MQIVFIFRPEFSTASIRIDSAWIPTEKQAARALTPTPIVALDAPIVVERIPRGRTHPVVALHYDFGFIFLQDSPPRPNILAANLKFNVYPECLKNRIVCCVFQAHFFTFRD
jgi:hypothetical protein